MRNIFTQTTSQDVKDKKALYALTAYAIILLFFVSPDSFTHDIFNCCDTPIFFMCGKAWMNGMIPYVDFADSKGPLLWLIQGIGYLISHHTYVGVWFLSCISYSIVFWYSYKLAKLFLSSHYLAFLSSIIMGAVYFNPWYHYEIKAEDWCQPFIIIALYSLCKYFYFNEKSDNKSLYKTAYIVGVCWAGPLLIKYSISVMMGIFLIHLLFFLIIQKKQMIVPGLLFFVGALSLFAPFAIYFCIIGNFNAFIQEYFLTTFKTIGESNTITNYTHEILLTIADPRYAIMFFSTALGCMGFAHSVSRFKYFPLISFCFFWAISIHHLTSYYYLTSNFSFAIFPVIVCVRKLSLLRVQLYNSKKILLYSTVFIITFLAIWNNTFTNGYFVINLFFLNNSYRQSYYKAASVLSQVNKPKILYLDCSVHGWETPVEGLPGSKYYFTQYGETKEMRSRKFQDIKRHLPDFICMEEAIQKKDAINIIKETGYHLCYDFHWWHHHFFFYTKHHNIKLPKDYIPISNWDILLKKKVITERTCTSGKR